MAIKLIQSDKTVLTTKSGTQIIFTNERAPEHRYIVVHPDNVEKAADILHDHVKNVAEKDIPLHAQEVSVDGKKVVFLSSGDSDFYFGLGEDKLVPNSATVTINLNAEFAPLYKKPRIALGRVFRGLKEKMIDDFPEPHVNDKASGFGTVTAKGIRAIAERIYQNHTEVAPITKGASAVFDNPNATVGHADGIEAGKAKQEERGNQL